MDSAPSVRCFIDLVGLLNWSYSDLLSVLYFVEAIRLGRPGIEQY